MIRAKRTNSKPPQNKGKRIVAWSSLTAYVATIFLTIPCAPSIWLTVNEKTGRILPKILPLLAISIFGVLYGMLIKENGLHERKKIACLSLAVAGYTMLFFFVARGPLEQYHLMEYSLLSGLVYLAFSYHGDFKKIVGWGLLLVVVVGAVDELYQWYLPHRFFDWRDICLNSLSGLLGFLLIGLFTADTNAKETCNGSLLR